MADGISDCCSAKVTEWGMCMECKEHCAVVDKDDEAIARENEIMDR